MLVNMHEAKTHLSRLVARAAAGEEIIIAKAGTPMARLVPFRSAEGPRPLGLLEGTVWIADDFDETPGWLVGEFEGEVGSGEPGAEPDARA